ncbi:voltage-gated potassium channel subunit beta-2 isoform X2 [Colias croceus]|uniref:voltage-gated potassium channel subunit beta-2 isoform X2 n=1 Tax=Colias crocea TaxID=72248 RepID=UPI001E27F308|nr:voltage-gated potassium channel subunit beta-2 isoform X2 [Colias croceus]
MRRLDMQREGGKEGTMSRSESTVSRCTPHTPLGPPDSVSVDSNPMPTIYRCRAPIASLDCMDEFSANSQQMLDQVGDINMSKHVSVYMGNHASMPSSVTPGLRYKNLGKSGLRVPNIGLGLWTMLNEDIAEDIIMTALENGINLFDLSEAHYAKGETELGKILKKRNVRRSSVIITTKIYWSTKSDERGQSRKHIIESVKASLARLQVDYIDVVLLHKVDPVCPMEELVRAMNFVINKGYVMYWGTARWSPSEIMDAYSKCRAFNCITPVVEQTEYHMFCRDKAELYMPELYHKIGVGTMAWSAITTGKGLNREEVTGLFAKSRFNRKYSTFSWCEEDLAVADAPASNSKEQTSGEEQRTYGDKLQALSNLANSLNCSMSQLAVAWCLKNENVNCLLLGATSVEQFKENIHALQIVPQLSPVVMVDIERLLSNKPQRPPMVSTLAMRNQQNTNAAKTDAAGASTSGVTTPKPDADVEANVATPEKEAEKTCEIQ